MGAALAALVGCGAPEGEPAPTDSPVVESDTPAPSGPSPARVHRLTRAQLARAAGELLGVEVDVARWLPADAQVDGFDNTEDGLYLSPDFVRGWDGAVHEAVRRALSGDAVRLDPQLRALHPSLPAPEDGWQSLGFDPVEVGFEAVTTGEHVVVLQIRRPVALDPGLVELQLDQQPLATAVEEVDLEAGLWTVRARALMPSVGHHALRLRLPDGALIGAMSIGPTEALPASPQRAALVPCAPASDDVAWGDCARTALWPLVRRAWRRPVDDVELDALVALVVDRRADGEPFEVALGDAIEATLLSPSFLFRLEAPGEGPVDDHVLASRLAFFLWSSLPDEALLDRADRGELHDAAVLRAEVARMLASPRRQGFVEDFAGQWLGFRDVATLLRDPAAFPLDTPELRAAMLGETSALVGRLLDGELSVADAMTEPLGDVAAPLHLLYGLDAPGERVDLAAVGRGGLLGQASLLTSTSMPTRTSIVQRGKFVLNALLCTSVAAPASMPVPDVDDPLSDVTSRAEDPSCRGCHGEMDPIGTALEHFDALGGWRDVYPSGVPVSSAGRFPDGRALDGLGDLEAVLTTDARVGRCLVQRVLTWAAGRGVDASDPAFAPALAAFEAGGGRLPALLEAVATSGLLTDVAEGR